MHWPTVLSWVQVGVLGSGASEGVMTGVDFEELSAMEQASAASAISVFARVEPQHKTKLVELLKSQVLDTLTRP